MADFPYLSLAGGVLIGLSASMLMVFNGRVAGISGVVGELWSPAIGETRWRLAFLGGLVGGGLVMGLTTPGVFATPAASIPLLVASGLLVGFGTRMANGCTSGHSVCGIPRGSPRSIASTVLFMGVAAAVVFATRQLGGGS